MTTAPTINRMPPPTVGMDFWQLRREGIEYIVRLGSDFWTDYNLHDPGITMLEVLCYAITDLSYRSNLPIGDLLATQSGNAAPSGMPLAPEVLTCNPVTFDDFRKLLIDIDGVKNSWVRKATEGWLPFGIETKDVVVPEKPRILNKVLTESNPIPLNGLYEILIDFDEQADCCLPEEVLQKVKEVLHQHRNLCEDYVHMDIVKTVDINLCSLIDIEEDVDVNDIAAEIFYRLQDFLTPTLSFYSLAQTLERNKTASFDDVFEGVLLQNGFIDDDELAASELKHEIHVSDFYNIIRGIEGVKMVKGIQLRKDGTAWKEWVLEIFTGKQTPLKPVLTLSGSNLDFRKRGNKLVVNTDIVEEKLATLRALNAPLSMSDKMAVSYPSVKARPDLTDYFTIQNDFPHTYHVGKEGLEQSETPLRKAQVKQMKAYLTFFDQILTNYLAYLANVKNLLSIEQPDNLPTRFSQPLYNVPFISDLLAEFDVQTQKSKPYDDFLATGLETEAERVRQKNSLLNHLIARFAETFSDYAMTQYFDDPRTPEKDDYLLRMQQNLPEKVRFLHQIPEIGRERGKGFNYQKFIKNKPDVWDTLNVEGLKKRVCALLGIADARRRTLTCPPAYKVVRFSSTLANRRGLSFLIADTHDKPLLEAFAPQPTEERRRQQLKETMDALTAEGAFKIIPKPKDEDRDIKITKAWATNKVIRFGHADNNNLILQKEKTSDVWRLLVLNPEEKILAQSVSFFETVGQLYDFLINLKTSVFNNDCDSEGFHIVEHILLRPRCEDCLNGTKAAIDLRKCLNAQVTQDTQPPQYANDVSDPYSFWITVVASKNWKRFNHPTNQSYFEQTLRAETPAHIGVRMCWLTNEQMFDFETAYGTWLVELAQHTPDRCQLDEAAHNLVAMMNKWDCNCCGKEEESWALPCKAPLSNTKK